MEKLENIAARTEVLPTGTGLFLPLDVMAELRLEGFVDAFPDVTLETLKAHIESNFDWAIALPRVQQKMVELVMAASGQFPA